MRVLLVGSGGREHALALALRASPTLAWLVAAPGNPGIEQVADRIAAVAADDVARLVALAVEERIDLVVVGPEAALAAGLGDALASAGIACFGPSRAAARLETSKAFTKAFCARHAIPTADSVTCDDPDIAKAALARRAGPWVVKADGLAAGKGVVVASTLAEAEAAVDEMFAGRFGAAGARVVVEDFLPGEEVSVFALCDGARAVILGEAQDHKRAFDGDTGPNTGGMGAYSPVPHLAGPAFTSQVMERIIAPAVAGMAVEGAPFVGVLFAGLMVGPDGPKLIEFNTRFGDPECQVLMARFDGDLAVTLMAAARGQIGSAPPFALGPRAAAAVVIAAQGYPDAPVAGADIEGVDRAEAIEGVRVLHAGTRRAENGRLLVAGGRVLAVVGSGEGVPDAVTTAYRGVERIVIAGAHHRRDIGARAGGDTRS